MTERVGIRALQQHASAVVRRAAEGHVIEITDHGRPVARLIPMPADPLSALVDAGQASPPRRSLREENGPLRRKATAPTLGELLSESRRDER